MKVREIRLRHWPLPGFKAITIYPFIFYRGEMTETLRKHEYHHIHQVEEMGWIPFYAAYLWYWIRYGYKNHPFEIEAREHAKH